MLLEREDPVYNVVHQNATFTAKRKDIGMALIPEDRKTQGLLLAMSIRDNLVLEYEIPKYEGDLGHPGVDVSEQLDAGRAPEGERDRRLQVDVGDPPDAIGSEQAWHDWRFDAEAGHWVDSRGPPGAENARRP